MNPFEDLDFETLAVHAGEEADPVTGAVHIPIHMASTFKLPKFGNKLMEALLLRNNRAPHVYTRWTNPTLRALEDRLVALEAPNNPRGAGRKSAIVFGSGMAAVSSLVLTFLSKGDHLIASDVCYAGSVELFSAHLPRFGIEVSLVDTSEAGNVEAALRPNTKLIYVETPANPILRITDIHRLAEIAHKAKVPLAVDSTFATPVLQKPFELGADFIVHSMTKYLNGHGDSLGGAILGKDKDILKIRQDMLLHLGGALSPFNAYMILRGMATLPLRMQKHCENGQLVAEFLESHPKVARVNYPGLKSHPQHELAVRQMTLPGGMISFSLKDGLGATISLLEKVKIFTHATSLGHAQSLLYTYVFDLVYGAATHLSPDQKKNIKDWTGEVLIRANIGLESAKDLIEDLEQGLRGKTIRGVAGPLAYKLLPKKK